MQVKRLQRFVLDVGCERSLGASMPAGKRARGPTKIGCVEGESSVQVGGVWSIAHVVADAD